MTINNLYNYREVSVLIFTWHTKNYMDNCPLSKACLIIVGCTKLSAKGQLTFVCTVPFKM